LHFAPTGLFEYRPQRADGEVPLRMRHGHDSGLGRMSKLVVASLCSHKEPAIASQPGDYVAAGHGTIIHTITIFAIYLSRFHGGNLSVALGTQNGCKSFARVTVAVNGTFAMTYVFRKAE
jgi:hypothetical protein